MLKHDKRGGGSIFRNSNAAVILSGIWVLLITFSLGNIEVQLKENEVVDSLERDTGIETFKEDVETGRDELPESRQAYDRMVSQDNTLSRGGERSELRNLDSEVEESASGSTQEEREEAGPEVVSTFTGEASWYGAQFHGSRTASGEVFNKREKTAAHRELPFGTRVRVTFFKTGKSTVVRINDRGPFAGDRIIDLSSAAAESIGLRPYGIGKVKVEVLSG